MWGGTAAQQAAAGTCSAGEGTAQLAPRRGRGPCLGQAGAWKGVRTAGEPGPCCSLQGRGFCESWVLVEARGSHKLLCLQDAIVPSPTSSMPADNAGSPATAGHCPECFMQQPWSTGRTINIWSSVSAGVVRKLQGGPGAPLPVGRQPGLQGGLCSGGICALHETRLVLTALPSEAVPLLLQLFGWMPNSRRKE